MSYPLKTLIVFALLFIARIFAGIEARASDDLCLSLQSTFLFKELESRLGPLDAKTFKQLEPLLSSMGKQERISIHLVADPFWGGQKIHERGTVTDIFLSDGQIMVEYHIHPSRSGFRRLVRLVDINSATHLGKKDVVMFTSAIALLQEGPKREGTKHIIAAFQSGAQVSVKRFGFNGTDIGKIIDLWLENGEVYAAMKVQGVNGGSEITIEPNAMASAKILDK